MKAIILAGGLGTRISEETHLKPKPMIEIGGKPILWHIMKLYSMHGVNEFIICCGYKGYLIKEYFANYFLHMSDVTFDMNNNKMERMNGELRDREKVMRSLKRDDSPILTGMQIYHNYIRPHQALNGDTPADKCGIIVKGNNKWLTLIQNASNQN